MPVTPIISHLKQKRRVYFKERYKNPVFVALTTYFEVLPIGLVVAIISALILKRKKAGNVAPVMPDERKSV